MSDICVSVVVPMYNVEKYIAECVESIINQLLLDQKRHKLTIQNYDEQLKKIKSEIEKDHKVKNIEKQIGKRNRFELIKELKRADEWKKAGSGEEDIKLIDNYKEKLAEGKDSAFPDG